MEQAQLGIRIYKKLHKQYLIHALTNDITLTDWVKNALENQFKRDKLKKK